MSQIFYLSNVTKTELQNVCLYCRNGVHSWSFDFVHLEGLSGLKRDMVLLKLQFFIFKQTPNRKIRQHIRISTFNALVSIKIR